MHVFHLLQYLWAGSAFDSLVGSRSNCPNQAFPDKSICAVATVAAMVFPLHMAADDHPQQRNHAARDLGWLRALTWLSVAVMSTTLCTGADAGCGMGNFP